MGHESRIELWSPNLTTFCFAGFRTEWLRREEAMKTAGRENPNHGVACAPQPSTWRGRSEQISLDEVGCEARKIPADAEVFFLDFYLYRTYQDFGSLSKGRNYVLVIRMLMLTSPVPEDATRASNSMLSSHLDA